MMNPPGDERLLLLGCGILQKEIRHLIALNNWPLDTFFIDSMLHVDFEALSLALKKALGRHSSRRVLVYYGACHPLMDGMLEEAGVLRTTGQNCVEMLLGEELFASELAGGAYFLLEDWAMRWDHMIHNTFGANDAVTRAIFHEDRSSLLCLRTPCSEDFSSQAEAAGAQLGLPVRWLDVTLDNLQKCLLDSIAKTDKKHKMTQKTPENSGEEIKILNERLSRLAQEKSFLQLTISLINKIISVSGLDNITDNILRGVLNVIGGTNLVLYYKIDDAIHYADITGEKKLLDRFDDDRVLTVFTTGTPLEQELDFSETRMMTPEFTKAFTLVYPLNIGSEVVGVLKIEHLHISMKAISAHILTLLNYIAMALKNEILGHTRLKKANDELRLAKDTLQAAMDQSPAGIAIADAPDGKLRYVNDAGLLIRGGDRQSAVNGVSIAQYVNSWQLLDLDGNELRADEVPLARAIMFGEKNSREFIIRRKAGEDRVVSGNAAPVMNESGKVVAGIVVFTDITDRKRAEKTLRVSEEKYRNLFNNSEVGIYRSRLDGSEVLDANQKYLEIVGKSRDEVIGKPSVMNWVDPKEREEMVRRLIADGHVSGFEYIKLNKRDGSVRNCLTSVVLYREEGILEGSILDITERKKAEMERETALANIKKLEGIIPICMYCKNIRDDKDAWQSLEAYMSEHTDALFSHGICSACMEKHFPLENK